MTVNGKTSNVRGKWVFLSASYPSRRRNPAYAETADVRAISNAVVELVRAVFDVGGSLVFGGHPTISPLVLQIAESQQIPPGEGGTPRLRIYQSAVFEDREPEASKRIGELGIGERIETPAADGESPVFHGDALDPKSVAQSLERMRRQMFEDNRPIGAVFIGGMEGVEDEFRIAADYPRVRRYLVAAPGGAAGLLADRGEPTGPSDAADDLIQGLRKSQLYPWLMRSIVSDMGL